MTTKEHDQYYEQLHLTIIQQRSQLSLKNFQHIYDLTTTLKTLRVNRFCINNFTFYNIQYKKPWTKNFDEK